MKQLREISWVLRNGIGTEANPKRALLHNKKMKIWFFTVENICLFTQNLIYFYFVPRSKTNLIKYVSFSREKNLYILSNESDS